jgi:proline racemase
MSSAATALVSLRCDRRGCSESFGVCFALDYEVQVPGLGIVSVDIAWGGMIYAIVEATRLGIRINKQNGPS